MKINERINKAVFIPVGFLPKIKNIGELVKVCVTCWRKALTGTKSLIGFIYPGLFIRK
jgi:hypothetical protein